jgi:cysteine synthase
MFDLADEVIDRTAAKRAAEMLAKRGIVLPTFAQLADPPKYSGALTAGADIDPDDRQAANLKRVHWFNDHTRRHIAEVPSYFVLNKDFTGIDAPIAVICGDRFPMIRAHKVLAAYACLVTRLVTGGFDPTSQRAVWPSTGNYCRGGVAISRILGCRGVAVLPEGMSRERFDWLNDWVLGADDIIRTPGTESNVKEIYDKCAELALDPDNVILNQFSEFANYLVHYLCTGRAVECLFEDIRKSSTTATLAAFVAGTGSAGTLAAGDYLKTKFGSKIAAMEPIECPTMLYNGYGEHNIQGIGDKHIPLIQNVTNMDAVIGVSDVATDTLYVLMQTETGRNHLAQSRNISGDDLDNLKRLGLSGIGNVIAAIKLARTLKLGADDVVATVATDTGALYGSEIELAKAKHFAGGFGDKQADETYSDHVLQLGARDRDRIFNLGYYTWVEQQGVELDDFDARREQSFWQDLQAYLPRWDGLIEAFNDMAGGGERAKSA